MSRWIKFRKPMKQYPETRQQKKIKVAGGVIGLVCKGKKGKDFVLCRKDVLACLYGKDETKCTVQIQQAERTVTEKKQQ
jgi:hypothetical protein